MSRTLEIHVHFLPTLIPPGALRGGVAVVIDVLRATTVMVQALASGCEAVIPCGEVDEAKAVAASLPPGTAFLGGERGGLPIPGFDLGNSPGDYTPEVCRGRTLVMTTTNGTRAILASLEAERVLIAAFTNPSATLGELSLEFLKARGRPIHLVCAGTEGHVSFEDTLLAGLLARDLTARYDNALLAQDSPPRPDNGVLANDAARIAIGFWRDAEQSLVQELGTVQPTQNALQALHQRLARLLAVGRGGQNVKRIGLEKDFDDVARTDRYSLVAQLQRDPLRIVTADENEREQSSETR